MATMEYVVTSSVTEDRSCEGVARSLPGCEPTSAVRGLSPAPAVKSIRRPGAFMVVGVRAIEERQNLRGTT
jgi:hypothetical protein